MNHLAKKISESRKSKGFTQEELAEKAKVNLEQYSALKILKVNLEVKHFN